MAQHNIIGLEEGWNHILKKGVNPLIEKLENNFKEKKGKNAAEKDGEIKDNMTAFTVCYNMCTQVLLHLALMF